MRLRGGVAGLVLLLLACLGVGAAVGLALPGSSQSDVERQARRVAVSLRCPSCGGESVADSSAPLAQAMRREVLARVAAGEEPEEVRAWFAERYGPGVLLDPSRQGAGWLLVVLPVGAVVGAGVATGLVARRRARVVDVTAAQWATVDELLSRRGAGERCAPESPAGERLDALLERLGELCREGLRHEAEASRLVREAAGLAEVVAGPPPDAGVPPGGGPAAGAQSAAQSAAESADRRRVALPAAVLPSAVLAVGALAVAGVVVGAEPRPAAAPPTPAAALAGAGARLDAARELERQGRLAEAGDGYRAALAQRPDDAAVAFRLAFTLVRTGRSPEAEPFLRQVLAASPDHPEALLLLGTVRRDAGDPEAAGLLRRFVAVAPAHPAAERARALLGES